MSKLDTLLALANAGLPVPPATGVRLDGGVDATEVRRRLGCPPGTLYAVRSSYDAEDGGERSYAGQFLTLLNVGEEGLEDAVRRVAESYGQDVVYDGTSPQEGSQDVAGVAPEGNPAPSPVVIVQPMVDARMSGVAFTSSPEGFVGEAVVVIGRGLGEGVVTDSVDTATWHVTCDGQAWATGSTGVRSMVDDEVVLTVASLARRCADEMGTEADMEFAISRDGRIHILQARPITVIGGMPTGEALAGKVLLDNSNIVESYPGVVLPLTQDFASDMYERVFTAAATRLCGDPSLVSEVDGSLSSLVAFSDWHAYYRISSWYDLLSFLPASERIKAAWRRGLGVPDDEGDLGASVRIGHAAKARVARRFAGCLRRLPSLMAHACERAEAALDAADEALSDAGTFAELQDVYETLRNEVLAEWDVTLINDVSTFMFTSLAGEATKVAEDNRRQVESMAPVLAMGELVAVASARGLRSDDYLRARDAFVSEYGDRCIGELKLETKTWKTDPEMLDSYVRSRRRQEAGFTSIRPHSDPLGKDALSVTLRGTKADGDDGRHGVRTKAFSGRARSGAADRERSRLLRTRMFGVVREVFLRIGDLLAARRVLRDSRDVFYLRMREVRTLGLLVDAEDVTSPRVARAARSIMRIVTERKLREKVLSGLPIPSRVWVAGTMAGEVADHSIPSPATAGSSALRLSQGTVVQGAGTSRGTAVAPVVVVDGSDMSVDTVGKVIVTESTDPGWAFLISGAAGIVAERGSLLSHTAIISRELGIPAVVGIKGATDALADGDIVEIDGRAGTVRLVERAGTDDGTEGTETSEG